MARGSRFGMIWSRLKLNDGTLVRLSDVRVENAGYFVVSTDRPMSQGAEAFLDWLRIENGRGDGSA